MMYVFGSLELSLCASGPSCFLRALVRYLKSQGVILSTAVIARCCMLSRADASGAGSSGKSHHCAFFSRNFLNRGVALNDRQKSTGQPASEKLSK